MLPLALVLALVTTPARYLVFEIDRHDAVTLVSAEQVELAAPLESNLEPFRSSDDPRRVDVELRDAGGAAIYRTSVDVERYVRAEFPAGDGSIDGRWIERERTAFAVRVPAGGETIEVRAPRSRSVAQFAVRALPSTARTSASGLRIRSDAGNPANRMDLLVMGDGYTSSEVAQFDADVQRVTSQFFNIPPYSSYRSFVNVTSYFVASAQSGADHPNCSADPSAQTDPKSGQMVNTAFDASYCSFSIQRLLTVSSSKVFAAAAAVPDWDMILVIVNDSMYGGAGGAVSVVSTHAQAVGVAQHEFGHSFTALADEYSTPYPGYPACSDTGAGAQCEANVTNETTAALIKWSPWIAAGTPIPSPTTFSGVGLFLGARYQTTGFYRPKNDCLMKTLGRPFCEVCAQAYVLRLYNGWRGTPANGISLIEGVTPSASSLNASTGQTVSFRATILNPDGAPALVRWAVDGVQVAGATTSSYDYTALAGTHTVELRVSDPTSAVKASMGGGALSKTRSWTVTATGTAAPKKRRAVR